MSTSIVRSWEQLTLTRPEVVQVTLTVGILVQEQTTLFQVEALDATSGTTLACWSLPGRDGAEWLSDLDRALVELRHQVGAMIDPF